MKLYIDSVIAFGSCPNCGKELTHEHGDMQEYIGSMVACEIYECPFCHADLGQVDNADDWDETYAPDYVDPDEEDEDE